MMYGNRNTSSACKLPIAARAERVDRLERTLCTTDDCEDIYVSIMGDQRWFSSVLEAGKLLSWIYRGLMGWDSRHEGPS